MTDLKPDALLSDAVNRDRLRFPFRRPVRIDAAPGSPEGRTAEGRTLDISLSGVGLACKAAFASGEAVTVTFRVVGPGHGVVEERVAGRVVNFQAGPDVNRVGVVFLEPLRPATHPALARTVGGL